ncbi:MAG TPA: BatA and WFA domain-containing protein [Bacillales bacterium]|nr:BatA and WFA domain-containing protein [Bacillales bacterium]
MGFLTPASFWFLSFIGILILFYFFKKQFDRRVIPSVYLWEQTIKEWETNRWWKRLQHSLLLLLQILVMLFLIFSLARPYVSGEGISGNHLVVVLDTSASMAVQEEGGSRFEQAKEQARQLIGSLTDKQAVTLIAAKRSPRLVETKTYDHGRIREAVQDLTLSYQHADLIAAVRLGQSLVAEHGEIHIFTDALNKKQFSELNLDTRLTVHNIGTAQPNVSLAAFGVSEENNGVSAIVTVKNETGDARAVTVSISHGRERLKRVTKQVSAKERLTMTVKGLPEEGVYRAEVEEKDAYPLDNSRWAFLSAGEPGTLYLAGEINPFLRKALQYSGARIVQVAEGKKGAYRFPDDTGSGAVYILSGIPASDWPQGAKWILSPQPGGPFDIKEKKTLNDRLQQKADDPMLKYVNVEDVYLGKAYPADKLDGLRPLVVSGTVPIVAKGKWNGAKTVLFAFDIRDSDWPLHPGFPILVQNVLAYLTKHNETLGFFLPGEKRPVTFAPTAQSAKIETAGGRDIRILDLRNPVLEAPDKPGLYRLAERTADGLRMRYFAVSLDEREQTAQSAESFTLTRGEDEHSAGQANLVKHEWWRLFAAMALFLLFTEWEVYRRGIASR